MGLKESLAHKERLVSKALLEYKEKLVLLVQLVLMENRDLKEKKASKVTKGQRVRKVVKVLPAQMVKTLILPLLHSCKQIMQPCCSKYLTSRLNLLMRHLAN